MDDIDDLFTEQLNDGLNDELHDQLNGELVEELSNGLNGHLNGELVEALDEQLNLPTVVAPPAGLNERLDELHGGGCNQSMAWSRVGALACIGADRKTVSIRCLQFQHAGSWKLSDYTDPALMDKLSGFYRGCDFVHVAWGPQGTELLVIDACGRIAVGYVYVTLNRIMVQKALNYDTDDNLNAVVALKWLNQIKKPILVPGAATKEDGHWKYPLSPSEPRGPFSPTQKSGFLLVTRGSMLKVYLQGMTPADWMEVKYELEGISSSYEVISHATMCPERNVSKKDDEILLAIHTTARRLRLYTVRIDWQASQDSIGVTPSIYVQHIAQLDRCTPSLDQGLLTGSIGIPHEEAELCFLTLLPRQPPQPGQSSTGPPTVLAVFSQNSPSGTVNSIISRWSLEESAAVVDPTFSQLSTKRASSKRLSDERGLKLLGEIKLDRLVINIDLISHDTIVALCYTTGEVEFRDRDLNMLPLDDKLQQATSLNRLGFTFDNPESCLQTVLAPHGTVKVSLNKAHEHKLASMHLQLPLVDSDVISHVTASFVLQHAASEGVGTGPTDDLVMTMWEFQQQLTEDQRKNLETQFMRDLYQLLQVTARSADKNVDGLIKFTPLGRTVGLQSSLAVRTTGDGRLRWERSGKIAFALQSLRIIALSLSFSVANLQKGQELDLHRPETLDYITPQVKWFITLVDYILDQLFQVNRVMGTDGFNGDAVAAKAPGSYACLVLVMCTITRNYLRYILRAIRALPQILHSISQTQSPLTIKYTALSAALRSCVISPIQFDHILEGTDHILSSFYREMKPGHRQEIEMQLLVEASIPTALNPIIHKLLSQPIEQTRIKAGDGEEILAFRQWGPVSLVDDRQTLMWEAETIWDGSRKVEITGKNVRTRTCLRCTGVMEEPLPGKDRANRVWLTNLTRTCFCGGHWIVNPPPETT